MKPVQRSTEHRTWFVAVGLAVVVVGGVLLLFKTPSLPKGQKSEPNLPSIPPTETNISSVGLTRLNGGEGDTVLKEEATLLDPTPLFLPTEWNVGQNALPINLIRGSGQVFQDYAPKLIYGEADLQLTFPAVLQVPAKPVDALAVLEPEQPFAGLGRTDRPVFALTGRGALVEIAAAGSGRRVFTQIVAEADIPAGNWRPLEFLVAVDAAGLVGPPAIMTRSGSETVDDYFQNLLAKTLRVGDRLAPGAYRICIGP